MWYKNIAGRFFGLATKQACDGQTDGIAVASTALAMRALRRAVKRVTSERTRLICRLFVKCCLRLFTAMWTPQLRGPKRGTGQMSCKQVGCWVLSTTWYACTGCHHLCCLRRQSRQTAKMHRLGQWSLRPTLSQCFPPRFLGDRSVCPALSMTLVCWLDGSRCHLV